MHVDRALLEQELGALEAFGQLLAHGLLDHARAGEADQRAGLGDHEVADEGEATPTRRPWSGSVSIEMNGSCARVSSCSTAVVLAIWNSELHAFLHARAARRRRRTRTAAVLVRDAHAAHEALADHRAHRAAHEVELERGEHERHALARCPASRPARRSRRSPRARPRGARDTSSVLELEGVDRQRLRSRSRSGLRDRAAARCARARRCGCDSCTSGRRGGSSRGRCDRAPPRTTGT